MALLLPRALQLSERLRACQGQLLQAEGMRKAGEAVARREAESLQKQVEAIRKQAESQAQEPGDLFREEVGSVAFEVHAPGGGEQALGPFS